MELSQKSDSLVATIWLFMFQIFRVWLLVASVTLMAFQVLVEARGYQVPPKPCAVAND